MQLDVTVREAARTRSRRSPCTRRRRASASAGCIPLLATRPRGARARLEARLRARPGRVAKHDNVLASAVAGAGVLPTLAKTIRHPEAKAGSSRGGGGGGGVQVPRGAWGGQVPRRGQRLCVRGAQAHWTSPPPPLRRRRCAARPAVTLSHVIKHSAALAEDGAARGGGLPAAARVHAGALDDGRGERRGAMRGLPRACPPRGAGRGPCGAPRSRDGGAGEQSDAEKPRTTRSEEMTVGRRWWSASGGPRVCVGRVCVCGPCVCGGGVSVCVEGGRGVAPPARTHAERPPPPRTPLAGTSLRARVARTGWRASWPWASSPPSRTRWRRGHRRGRRQVRRRQRRRDGGGRL